MTVLVCVECGKPLVRTKKYGLLHRTTQDAIRCQDSLRYALPNVNGGDEASGYKGVLKEDEAP